MILRYIIQLRACFWCIFLGRPVFFDARLSQRRKERKKRHLRGEKDRRAPERKKERKTETTRTWRESRTLSPKMSIGLQNPNPKP